jgi:hypothetical protein
MTHMRDPTRTSSTTATVSPLMEDPYLFLELGDLIAMSSLVPYERT